MPFDPATLKYDAQGLIPCIAQDADTGDVLMLAWLNAAAVAQTLATGRVTYWSRSRAAFWVKGGKFRAYPRAGGVAARLRPRWSFGPCAPNGPRLPHQPAQLFLHRRAGRGRG